MRLYKVTFEATVEISASDISTAVSLLMKKLPSNFRGAGIKMVELVEEERENESSENDLDKKIQDLSSTVLSRRLG